DVVAVVESGRGVERQKPQRRTAEVLQVVELRRQAREVADAVAVAVEEGTHVQLVDHGVLVPVGHSLALSLTLLAADAGFRHTLLLMWLPSAAAANRSSVCAPAGCGGSAPRSSTRRAT